MKICVTVDLGRGIEFEKMGTLLGLANLSIVFRLEESKVYLVLPNML